MPKIVSYTRASLAKALELAKAVDSLGGACKQESCAEQMGYKLSGGFSQVVSATSKFGLIEVVSGQFKLTDDYKKLYKNAYDEKEKITFLRKCFLSIPLYQDLYNRFKGSSVPDKNALPKFLIREYGVDEDSASRVAGYFIDGSAAVELMGDAGSLKALSESTDVNNENIIDQGEEVSLVKNNEPVRLNNPLDFVISIKGPDMDNCFAVKDEDDIAIIRLILEKLSKKIRQNTDMSKLN